MEPALRHGAVMGHEPPLTSVSAGPQEPAVKERALPAEPTVVIAWGVAAEEPPRAPARPRDERLTIPPEREIVIAAKHARLQTRLFTFAACLFFASAGLLAKQVLDESKSGAHKAAAVANVTVTSAPAPEPAPQPIALAAAPKAPPIEELIAATAAPTSPEPPSAPEIVRTEAPAPSAAPARSSNAVRRATRVMRKPKHDAIVRESPF